MKIRRLCNCDKFLQFMLNVGRDEYTTIKKNPDNDGWLLLVQYRDRDKDNPREFSWGMRLYHCNFCGRKLKSGK